MDSSLPRGVRNLPDAAERGTHLSARRLQVLALVAEGASDGWCIKQPTEAWTIRCVFAANEHFTPGKKYKLCMRVKGTPETGVEPSKVVWNYGVTATDGKYPTKGRVTAEQMKGGAWTVIESTPWTPTNGDSFYFAVDPKAMKAVYIDCMWLEEVKDAAK